MVFQLRDDVLDVIGTEKELGKPAGQDLAEGIYTLPVLLALRDPDVGPELTALWAASGPAGAGQGQAMVGDRPEWPPRCDERPTRQAASSTAMSGAGGRWPPSPRRRRQAGVGRRRSADRGGRGGHRAAGLDLAVSLDAWL